MTTRKNIAFIITVILLLLSSTKVHADVAPPEPPSGTDPEPGNEITNVRMVSETVLIQIDADSPLDNGDGKVTATFTMRNLGDVDEQMDVRFPLDQTVGWGKLCMAPSFQYPTIDDIRVKVNGNSVSTHTTYQTVPVETENEPSSTTTIPCWANFPVSFPAGKDVIIQVAYTAQPYDSGGYNYSYVLVTGAGWKDTIGSADIIYEVPYELNETNFISCFPNDCSVGTTKVQWHYENFDPPFNVTLSLLSPPIWKRILIERKNTSQNPNDGEAWGRLAKAYKEAILERRGFRSDEIGQGIYQLSRDAYQKATALLPNDADWHFGLAQLLCWNAEWNNFLVASSTEAWKSCVDQIQQVLNLNPNHAGMKEFIENSPEIYDMIDFSGSQPDYIILTPKSAPTLAPTEKQIPGMKTETAIPSPTARFTNTVAVATILTSTPTAIFVQESKESDTSFYIVGLILIFFVTFLIMRLRKS
jgi:hypothetical protein